MECLHVLRALTKLRSHHTGSTNNVPLLQLPLHLLTAPSALLSADMKQVIVLKLLQKNENNVLFLPLSSSLVNAPSGLVHANKRTQSLQTLEENPPTFSSYSFAVWRRCHMEVRKRVSKERAPTFSSYSFAAWKRCRTDGSEQVSKQASNKLTASAAAAALTCKNQIITGTSINQMYHTASSDCGSVGITSRRAKIVS